MGSDWGVNKKLLQIAVWGSMLLAAMGVLGVMRGCKEQSANSPPLMDFLQEAFSGEEGALAAAVAKYGDSSIISDDLTIFLVTNPIVEDTFTQPNGITCHHIRATAGITQRKYEICWQEGRLIKITDLGMVLE